MPLFRNPGLVLFTLLLLKNMSNGAAIFYELAGKH
jgi:hypothetical protein